jgi:hypothetical protein
VEDLTPKKPDSTKAKALGNVARKLTSPVRPKKRAKCTEEEVRAISANKALFAAAHTVQQEALSRQKEADREIRNKKKAKTLNQSALSRLAEAATSEESGLDHKHPETPGGPESENAVVEPDASAPEEGDDEGESTDEINGEDWEAEEGDPEPSSMD